MIIKRWFVFFGIVASFFGGWLMLNVLARLNAINVGIVEIESLLLFLIGAVFFVGAGIIHAIHRNRE